MAIGAKWHGTTDELDKLQAAIKACCACDDGPAMCGSHQMMYDQNVLDHLAFVDRDRMRFIAGEWDVETRS